MDETWDYDPRKRLWYSNLGGSITDVQLRKLPVDQQMRITGMPMAPASPRRAGKSSFLDSEVHNLPLPSPIRIDLVPAHTVIQFLTHGRYTYAAVFAPTTGLSDPCWYITGAGKWFGTNVLTTDQMSEVLMRETTSYIRVMQGASSLLPVHHL
jgi:hypothetical protein